MTDTATRQTTAVYTLSMGGAMHGGAAIDAVIFDVDGVLIDTSRSFPYADVAAIKYIVQMFAPDGGEPAVDLTHIQMFRKAGGFNSDWDMTQGVTALLIAQRTVWRDAAHGALTLQAFADQAAQAYAEQRGGLGWIRQTVPATAIPSDQLVHEVVDQYYWGSELYARYFPTPAYAIPAVKGFVHEEVIQASPSLLDDLVDAGIRHLGLITGRVGPGLVYVIDRFRDHFGLPRAESPESAHQSRPQDQLITNVIDLDHFVKPDPRALAHMVHMTRCSSGIYVGDTRDDLQLVLRYRREMPDVFESQPFLSAIVTRHLDEAPYFLGLGADMTLGTVNEVLEAVIKLQQA